MTVHSHQELANLPEVELIQNDGSPAPKKLFILWNPIVKRENVGALLWTVPLKSLTPKNFL